MISWAKPGSLVMVPVAMGLTEVKAPGEIWPWPRRASCAVVCKEIEKAGMRLGKPDVMADVMAILEVYIAGGREGMAQMRTR